MKKIAAVVVLFVVLLGIIQTSYGTACETSKNGKQHCDKNAVCVKGKSKYNVCKCKVTYIGDGFTCEYLPTTLKNVALDRLSTQSTTFGSFTASKAVDGRMVGCSQTKMERNPWWRVDLGKSVWVEKVLIIKDLKNADLKNADIRIGDKQGRAKEQNPLCRQGLQVPKERWLYSCAEPMLGRYVYIITNTVKPAKLALCEVEVYVNKEAISKDIKYLVPRTQGKYLETASYIKYAGNDHFYLNMKFGSTKIPRRDIIIDLPPKKGSLKIKDQVVFPVDFVKGKDKCGPTKRERYLNGTLLETSKSTVEVKSIYVPLGKNKKQEHQFNCDWKYLRVKGSDVCQLENKCAYRTRCDTKYISPSFPPGSYHCACVEGYVPASSNPLPGNVILPGEQCKRKPRKESKIWHSGQNVALKMKTIVSSTDNYAGCKTKNCKEVPAFGRFITDGSIKTCFRSLKEDSPWLTVHLDDYYSIFLVRIATSGEDLHRVKVYVGDKDKRKIGTRRNNLPLFAFKDGKIPKNRQLSFGCDEVYLYGNAVKIETDSSKSILSLCEVEVYANPYVNIALNQFSEGKTGNKAKHSELAYANDGNLETCFTFSPQHPYWYLELGVNVRVSVVYILHASSTNLKGFNIVVGKDSGKTKKLCTTISKYSNEEGVGNYFECKKPVVGSFLNISLKQGSPRQISLCEVEVYQTTIINVAAKRFAESSGNKNPNRGVDQNIDAVFFAKKAKSPTWLVKLAAVCDIHLIRIITAVDYKPADFENLVIKAKVLASSPGYGKVIARLRNTKKELVQTITLQKNTKARFVTFKLDQIDATLKFREIEIYNKPLFDVNECKNPSVSCPWNHRCQNLPNSYKCVCDGGFHLTGRKKNKCKDIDECSKNTYKCNSRATCTNTVGSYKCTCNPGFAGDGVKICSKLKPCKNNKDCEQNQDCKSIKGTKLCNCKKGYLYKGKDKPCIDQNECKDNICGVNSVCTNAPGSYKCNCLDGYESKNDDGKNCFDKDECEAKQNPCADVAVCKNTLGSFRCNCPAGFFYDYDKKECYDVDECASSTSCGPNMECINTVGSHSCKCLQGYRAEKNQKGCIDINECEEETYNCPQLSRCKNKMGGYECLCKTGYEKTKEAQCSEICTPKCDENSFCENGKCLCRGGFTLGLEQKCRSIKSLSGTGMSLQSSFMLLAAILPWCLAFIISR